MLNHLIRDTLCFLRECNSSVLFANAQEHAFFSQSLEREKEEPKIQHAQPFEPIRREIKKEEPKSGIEKKIQQVPKPILLSEPTSHMKSLVQKIAPYLRLTDHIPADTVAQQASNAWKEMLPDVDVVLLVCDKESVEFLKNLGRAIDERLAKAKLILADRLEREKRWNIFLEKNKFRLIIVTKGLTQFPELMRHYRSTTAQAFLADIPLFELDAAITYQSPQQKSLLWKALCQLLT